MEELKDSLGQRGEYLRELMNGPLKNVEAEPGRLEGKWKYFSDQLRQLVLTHQTVLIHLSVDMLEVRTCVQDMCEHVREIQKKARDLVTKAQSYEERSMSQVVANLRRINAVCKAHYSLLDLFFLPNLIRSLLRDDNISDAVLLINLAETYIANVQTYTSSFSEKQRIASQTEHHTQHTQSHANLQTAELPIQKGWHILQSEIQNLKNKLLTTLFAHFSSSDFPLVLRNMTHLQKLGLHFASIYVKDRYLFHRGRSIFVSRKNWGAVDNHSEKNALQKQVENNSQQSQLLSQQIYRHIFQDEVCFRDTILAQNVPPCQIISNPLKKLYTAMLVFETQEQKSYDYLVEQVGFLRKDVYDVICAYTAIFGLTYPLNVWTRSFVLLYLQRLEDHLMRDANIRSHDGVRIAPMARIGLESEICEWSGKTLKIGKNYAEKKVFGDAKGAKRPISKLWPISCSQLTHLYMQTEQTANNFKNMCFDFVPLALPIFLAYFFNHLSHNLAFVYRIFQYELADWNQGNHQTDPVREGRDVLRSGKGNSTEVLQCRPIAVLMNEVIHVLNEIREFPIISATQRVRHIFQLFFAKIEARLIKTELLSLFTRHVIPETTNLLDKIYHPIFFTSV